MQKHKERLDLRMVERGLAPSREKAKAMIMAGHVMPSLATQTDYCNALDELWAGTITGDEFIAKCEASLQENAG